jgi:hypothetical protein
VTNETQIENPGDPQPESRSAENVPAIDAPSASNTATRQVCRCRHALEAHAPGAGCQTPDCQCAKYRCRGGRVSWTPEMKERMSKLRSKQENDPKMKRRRQVLRERAADRSHPWSPSHRRNHRIAVRRRAAQKQRQAALETELPEAPEGHGAGCAAQQIVSRVSPGALQPSARRT